MKLNKRTYKFFLLGLLAFLHCITKIYAINTSNLAVNFVQYLQYTDYILMLTSLEWRGYKLNELILYFALIIIAVILTVTSGTALFLCLALISIVAKNTEYKKICQALLWGIMMGFALSAFLYLMGLSDSGVHRRGAIALGFIHPNVCGAVIQSIVYLYFLAYGERNNKKPWFILVFGIAINAFVLDSRTTAVSLIMFPLLKLLIPKVLKRENKIIRLAIVSLPIVIFSFVIYLSVNYDYSNPFHAALDMIMNGRLTLNRYNYNQLGFGWFGRRIIIDHIALQGRNTIDCSYLVILLQLGIVGTTLFLLWYSLSLHKALKYRQYDLLACIILILAAGIMENTALDIVFAFPLIYLSDLDGTYNFAMRKIKNKSYFDVSTHLH